MTPEEKDDLIACLSLDMANARAERWRVRTMEARAELAAVPAKIEARRDACAKSGCGGFKGCESQLCAAYMQGMTEAAALIRDEVAR